MTNKTHFAMAAALAMLGGCATMWHNIKNPDDQIANYGNLYAIRVPTAAGSCIDAGAHAYDACFNRTKALSDNGQPELAQCNAEESRVLEQCPGASHVKLGKPEYGAKSVVSRKLCLEGLPADSTLSCHVWYVDSDGAFADSFGWIENIAPTGGKVANN